jgi:hypothetical protein
MSTLNFCWFFDTFSQHLNPKNLGHMSKVVLTMTLKWSWRTNIPCCLYCKSCNDHHYGGSTYAHAMTIFWNKNFVRRNIDNFFLVRVKWWISLIHQHIIFIQTQILSTSPSTGHNKCWYLKHHKQAGNLGTVFYADKLHINQLRATTSRLNVRSLNKLAIKFEHRTSCISVQKSYGVLLTCVSAHCFCAVFLEWWIRIFPPVSTFSLLAELERLRTLSNSGNRT